MYVKRSCQYSSWLRLVMFIVRVRVRLEFGLMNVMVRVISLGFILIMVE